MGEAVFFREDEFSLPLQKRLKRSRMNFNEVIFGSQHWFEDDTKLSRNQMLVYRNCLIKNQHSGDRCKRFEVLVGG